MVGRTAKVLLKDVAHRVNDCLCPTRSVAGAVEVEVVALHHFSTAGYAIAEKGNRDLAVGVDSASPRA